MGSGFASQDDKQEEDISGPAWDEKLVEGLVAQRMAPAIALRHLEPLFAEWEYVLRDFLGVLPGPDNDGGPLTLLEVTIAADASFYGIRAAAPAERMIAAAAEFFEKVGAEPQTLDDLASFGDEYDPAMLGMWLDLREGSANCGWFIPEGSMESAEGILLEPSQTKRLLAWADASRVGHFMAGGRSVAPGSALAFVEAPLAGDEVGQVACALALLGDFSAATPAEDILAGFMNGANEGLEVSLWLLEEGVARSGIRAEYPSLALVVLLAEAAGGQDLDLVAQVQGILQVETASAVEVQRRGDATLLLISYNLIPRM
jgi:hypothetical protein